MIKTTASNRRFAKSLLDWLLADCGKIKDGECPFFAEPASSGKGASLKLRFPFMDKTPEQR